MYMQRLRSFVLWRSSCSTLFGLYSCSMVIFTPTRFQKNKFYPSRMSTTGSGHQCVTDIIGLQKPVKVGISHIQNLNVRLQNLSENRDSKNDNTFPNYYKRGDTLRMTALFGPCLTPSLLRST